MSLLSLEGDFSSIDELELHQFQKLRRLSLVSPNLSDLSGISEVELKRLNLMSPNLSDLSEISKVRGLERLTIIDSKQLQAGELSKLKESDSLRSLSLWDLDMSSSTFLEINDFPELDHLGVDNCKGLKSIKCSNMTTRFGVNLINCHQLSSVELEDLPNLFDVSIKGCKSSWSGRSSCCEIVLTTKTHPFHIV